MYKHMFSNVFSWDHKGGKGPWGNPKGNRNTGGSRRKPSNPQNEGSELDDLLRGAEQRVRGMMNGGSNGGNGKLIGLVLIAVGVIWLGSGFYIVGPDEKGVVLRFGKYVQTTNPGPNYHLPWPVESVIKPRVTRENILEVGFRANRPTFRFGGTANRAGVSSVGQGGVDVPQESLMLTGDENIIDLDFTVRWRIADPRDFLFNVDDPINLIKNTAESAMREIIGKHPIDDALTENKNQIQVEMTALLQELLDSYRAGMQVTGAELQQVNPPQQVVDAFRDVQAARADAEKMQNEAIGYSNDIVPRARGEAAKLIQQAEAYKEAKVAEAQGSAGRFNSQLREYRKAKDVTSTRMYIETMEKVLKNSNKVIMSGEAGKGVLPYLPLNNKGGVK